MDIYHYDPYTGFGFHVPGADPDGYDAEGRPIRRPMSRPMRALAAVLLAGSLLAGAAHAEWTEIKRGFAIDKDTVTWSSKGDAFAIWTQTVAGGTLVRVQFGVACQARRLMALRYVLPSGRSWNNTADDAQEIVPGSVGAFIWKMYCDGGAE